MATAPILVLSPHPDDAALGCWSALDQLRGDVVVINVFAGIPPAGTAGGWDRECGVPDSVEMMRRRRAEDEQALATVGVTPRHLDFLDNQYTSEGRDLDAIVAAVERLAPWRSALYAPAAVGGFVDLLGLPGVRLDPHPDHQLVREVALRLHAAGVPTYLYAELPYAGAIADGARWQGTLTRFTQRLQEVVGDELELTMTVHTPEAVQRRMAALARYTTQMKRLQEGVGSFAEDPEILSREACWRLRSTDTGSGTRRQRPTH
jgi:LmbE family N-acetylglucosaminyl deacetylase